MYNRNRAGRPAPPGALLRPLGVLLSVASMALAVLAIFFFHSISSLLLAVIACLFGARVFALWLGVKSPAAPPAYPVAVQPWMPAPAAAQQQAGTGRLAPAPLPGSYSPVSSRQPAVTAPTAPAPLLVRPSHSSYQILSREQSPAALEQTPPSREPAVAGATLAAYVPIDQDEIFQLDAPVANERCFLLPKEGEPVVECQDRYALSVQPGRRNYAIADGVAGSFVPGPWARIVAQQFVQRAGSFNTKDDFLHWLNDCSRRWHEWITRRWVPTIDTLRERGGDGPGNWSNEIRKGAQTTLLGCTLSPAHQIEHDNSTAISIFAVGDCELFLLTPNQQGGWGVEDMFPFDSAAEFDAHPDTLVTADRPDLIERAWARRKTMLINAFPGDMLVLATDTLAKWILTQIERNSDRWQLLLSITDPGAFEQHIRREFHRDRVEDDDLTMLVIPI